MARNIVFDEANQLSLPVASGVKSGDPVRVGGLNGVALTDRGTDGNASVKLNGAPEFTVAFAVATVGLPIYITPAGALAAAESGNSLYGYSLTTKAAPSGPLTVRIAN